MYWADCHTTIHTQTPAFPQEVVYCHTDSRARADRQRIFYLSHPQSQAVIAMRVSTLSAVSLFGAVLVAADASTAMTDSTADTATTDPRYAYTPSLIPLLENADSTGLFPMANCNGFKLEEATIDQMQDAMRQGRLTSVQLVQCYLTRAFQTEEYIR